MWKISVKIRSEDVTVLFITLLAFSFGLIGIFIVPFLPDDKK